MKPTILIVVNDAGFFLSHRAHIASKAMAEGFDVVVACPEDGNVAKIGALGLRYRPYGVPRGVGRPIDELKAAVTLAKIIRAERPAALHLVTAKPVIVGGLIARVMRIPTLAAITGLGHIYVDPSRKSRLLRAVANLGFRYALRHERSFTMFQNQENLNLFMKLGIIGSNFSLVKGAGVSLSQFDPRCNQNSNEPVILLPARMLKTKGVYDFVEAAKLLRKQGVTAKFVLAGAVDMGNPAGIPREELQQLTASGLVEWIGHQDNIATAMAAAAVVVLPSYYNEGMPKSLLDAAAAGRPVVTTDIAGCRDAIIPEITGILVRPRDPQDLAAKLSRLIADPQLRVRMGAAGRELAEREFADTLVASKHIDIYNMLTANQINGYSKESKAP